MDSRRGSGRSSSRRFGRWRRTVASWAVEGVVGVAEVVIIGIDGAEGGADGPDGVDVALHAEGGGGLVELLVRRVVVGFLVAAGKIVGKLAGLALEAGRGRRANRRSRPRRWWRRGVCPSRAGFPSRARRRWIRRRRWLPAGRAGSRCCRRHRCGCRRGNCPSGVVESLRRMPSTTTCE